MKLNFITALSVLVPFIQANPIATSDVEVQSELEARAGPYCHTTENKVHCYKGAGLSYTIKRNVDKKDNAGVNCKAYGDTGNGHRGTFFWVPGWECWLWSEFVNSACGGQQPWCATGSGNCPTHDC